jgi:serine phosphatase RsbU (regulator of sigma subunit)
MGSCPGRPVTPYGSVVMTIRNRIAFSFVGILLLFGFAVGIFMWTATLRSQTMTTLDRALKRQVLIGSIRQQVDNLHKQVTLLSNMDFGDNQAANTPEAQTIFHQQVDEVSGLLDQLELLADPWDRSRIQEIKKTYSGVATSWRSFYEYLGVEQTWALANIARADPLSMKLQTELLPQFQAAESERVVRAEADFNRVQKLTSQLSIVIFLISGAIAATVAYALSRYIGHGFSVLKHGTDVIGNMDLEHRIQWPSHDELGDFAKSFNTMAGRLLQARNQLTEANVELEKRADEIARRQQLELQLAATIQQGLMQVRIPETPFARIQGRNLSCTQIGGDFFDVLSTPEGLAVSIIDVSGKGISAAIMASMLQGMIRSELAARVPLNEVVANVNRFFTQRDVGGKYATLSILRLNDCGNVEYVNCGHVPPVMIRGGMVLRLTDSNLPVGLIPEAAFKTSHCQLRADDRIILVTDGVTEAANCDEEFFGDERLELAAVSDNPLESVFTALDSFCAGTPFNDDCTVVELTYTGQSDMQYFKTAATN